MIRKKPTVQYICPLCKKVISGYTKIQVYSRYVVHLAGKKCIYPSPSKGEKEEMIKKCQKILGISDAELHAPREKG
jgi:DNA transposition AAA+ family ATPase